MFTSATSGTIYKRTIEAATQAACAGKAKGYHSEYGNSLCDNKGK